MGLAVDDYTVSKDAAARVRHVRIALGVHHEIRDPLCGRYDNFLHFRSLRRVAFTGFLLFFAASDMRVKQ